MDTKIYSSEQPGTFFIEGVISAGEVKSVLTVGELRKTLTKSMEFKKLQPKFAAGTQVFAVGSDFERFVSRRPYFLFALESKVTMPKIIQVINDYCASMNVSNRDVLDAVFCLDRGTVIDFDDGTGALSFESESGTKQTGWVWTSTSGVMIDLLGWLSATIRKVNRHEQILLYYLVNTR